MNIKKKRIGTGVYVNDYSDAKKDFILPQFEPFLITLTQEEAGFQQTEIMETIVTVPMPEQIKTMVKRIKTDGVAYHDDIMIVAETAVGPDEQNAPAMQRNCDPPGIENPERDRDGRDRIQA